MSKTQIIDRAYIKVVFINLTVEESDRIIASAGFYEWKCILAALVEELGDEFFGSDYSLALIEERIK